MRNTPVNLKRPRDIRPPRSLESQLVDTWFIPPRLPKDEFKKLKNILEEVNIKKMNKFFEKNKKIFIK